MDLRGHREPPLPGSRAWEDVPESVPRLLLYDLWNDPAARIHLPAKYFDYITTGNPVLVLGNRDSDLARIVAQDQSGACLAYDEVAEISRWLVALAKNDQAMRPNSLEICRRRSALKLAADIAGVLDEVTGIANQSN